MSPTHPVTPEPVDPEVAAAGAAPLRDQRNTAAGCRERAAADLLEAVTMCTANGRARMESSASNWSQRALLLDRMEARAEARRALPASLDGEDPHTPRS